MLAPFNSLVDSQNPPGTHPTLTHRVVSPPISQKKKLSNIFENESMEAQTHQLQTLMCSFPSLLTDFWSPTHHPIQWPLLPILSRNYGHTLPTLHTNFHSACMGPQNRGRLMRFCSRSRNADKNKQFGFRFDVGTTKDH